MREGSQRFFSVASSTRFTNSDLTQVGVSSRGTIFQIASCLRRNLELGSWKLEPARQNQAPETQNLVPGTCPTVEAEPLSP